MERRFLTGSGSGFLLRSLGSRLETGAAFGLLRRRGHVENFFHVAAFFFVINPPGRV